MSNSNKETILKLILSKRITEKEFDGNISPKDTWEILQQENLKKEIFLVDVRTNEERVFTGIIPESVHVAWATGTNFTRNPRFVREIESKINKNEIILLLCRSGNRSKQAATVLKTAGFEHVYNIQHGFEGDLNEQQQRNTLNGWKHEQLPWIQT